MRVDMHTHFLPEPYRNLLREWDKSVRIEDRDGSPFVVHTTGSFPLFPGFRDLDARLKWMDEHDFDVTVASVSTPTPYEGPFTVDESTELARAVNDGYADMEEETGGRVVGLGSLPLRDPEASLEELDRIQELGLAGVALPSTVRGEKLSDPELEPVFDALDDSGLTAFMHPCRNSLSQELGDDEWFFNPLGVFPAETGIQIGRLIFDGFFDRHDFDLVLSHLGGVLPYLVGRFERGRDQFRSGPDDSPEREVLDYVREFYYDTISFHVPAIEMTIETVGADHVVFGSDYPFGMEKVGETLENVEELDLEDDAYADVMGETSAELFGL